MRGLSSSSSETSLHRRCTSDLLVSIINSPFWARFDILEPLSNLNSCSLTPNQML